MRLQPDTDLEASIRPTGRIVMRNRNVGIQPQKLIQTLQAMDPSAPR